jgi:hypothetical protein
MARKTFRNIPWPSVVFSNGVSGQASVESYSIKRLEPFYGFVPQRTAFSPVAQQQDRRRAVSGGEQDARAILTVDDADFVRGDG